MKSVSSSWPTGGRNTMIGSANQKVVIRPHDPPSLAASIAKEFLEPLRRQGGIARRILNVAMPKIRLNRACVVAIVGKLVAAGVPQHVGAGLDAEVRDEFRSWL